jgi:DnaJ like chaperone protein
MSIWSRISDVASNVTGSIAGVFSNSSKPPEKTVAFTIAMIALSAKMARADGVVSSKELKAFGEVFQVPENDRASVERVFNLAKQDVAGFESYAQQAASLFGAGAGTLENVLDGLFHIAKADGAVHEDELTFLARVADIFGFAPKEFDRIRARHVILEDDPYLVLGLPNTASLDEVKKHYRKLARELHPDKQVAAGMPPELVVIASERLARINAAYNAITKDAVA